MSDPKLMAATALMGRLLAGLSMTGQDELAADIRADEEQQRVWVEMVLPSGDVYEISTRWVREKSP